MSVDCRPPCPVAGSVVQTRNILTVLGCREVLLREGIIMEASLVKDIVWPAVFKIWSELPTLKSMNLT